MHKIDLNCDMGESFGAYKLGLDRQLMPYITCANVACGFHAGDSSVMRETVEMCAKNGVAVGAHPGFPDLQGFGRRNMAVTPQEAGAYVTYQIGALWGFCKAAGVEMHHVKPHGALYNMAAKNFELSLEICKAVHNFDEKLIILAPFGSQTIKAAQALNMPFACEVFADRAYMPDGLLVPRTMAGAMITDEKIAINRVIGMVLQGKVQDIEGNSIAIAADTVCVHGDNEKALQFVQGLRAAFDDNKIQMSQLV